MDGLTASQEVETDDRSRRDLALMRVIALVVAVGASLTAAAAWAAWTLDHRNEHRLLHVQTRQAAALIGAEVANLTSPLETALQVANATGGDAGKFSSYVAAHVGPGRPFVNASLWRVDGGSPELVTSVDTGSERMVTTGELVDLIRRSVTTRSPFTVQGLPVRHMTRVAYAIAQRPAPGFVVFAERAIPASRRVPVEDNPAFASLHFVTYLGDTTRTEDLATTDMAPSDLPLRGLTDRVQIPFGDTVITLVASRRDRLGGSLGAQLPWIFLAVGLLATAATARGTERHVRRRLEAERDTATIAGLYRRLDDRFDEQRHISETLQRALLPQRNPVVPGLEIASRYMAGTRGVEVGGDWYSMVTVDDEHFAFAVGDVSGRGLSAAVIMARLRFTIRAYLLEGHRPDRVLGMCTGQIDVTRDEHFATVLVGVGNLATREITFANAGHLNPVIITADGARLAETAVGVPLGVDSSASYEVTTVVMAPGSALIAFTDGLVERRGEDLLCGLGRLTDAAAPIGDSLDESLTRIVSVMNHEGSEDDIAILAFRWADNTRA